MNREQWLGEMLEQIKPIFAKAGTPIPANVAVSCAWPSQGGYKRDGSMKVGGQCWDKSAAKDKKFNIFISPMMDKGEDVAGVLVHEAVHAAVGLKAGHRAPFKKLALAIGLEGKMKSTYPGTALKTTLKAAVAKVGAYPHGKIDITKGPTKKQPTRMVKLECNGCGYILRTTAKWIATGVPKCHCSAKARFIVDEPEEDGDGEDE